MSEMEDLAALTAQAVLLLHAGDSILHWPAGEEDDEETVTAIVDRSEQISEFAVLETQAGRKVPKRWLLSLATSVTVTVTEEPKHNSRFVIDGAEWFAERILSIDAGLQVVQIKSAAGVHVNRSSR
jgi:hypothetical protein